MSKQSLVDLLALPYAVPIDSISEETKKEYQQYASTISLLFGSGDDGTGGLYFKYAMEKTGAHPNTSEPGIVKTPETKVSEPQ